MSMKKSDVKDLTIRPEAERMIGDVTKISTSDTAKSGTDQTTGKVQAPAEKGQPSQTDGDNVLQYVPSLQGLPPGTGNVDNSAAAQPDMGKAPQDDTVATEQNGKGVVWPDAANMAAAAGMTSGAAKDGGTLMLKTGTKQPFPVASLMTAPVKTVDSFDMKSE